MLDIPSRIFVRCFLNAHPVQLTEIQGYIIEAVLIDSGWDAAVGFLKDWGLPD